MESVGARKMQVLLDVKAGRMRWLDKIPNSMDMNLSKLRGIVKDRGAWRAAVHGVSKTQTRLRN